MTQRAKQIALEDRFGSVEDQYRKLPSLVKQIQACDTDASVHLDVDNGVFCCLFWSYGAAKEFPTYQRKLFSIDGGSMKHFPKGTLLILASEDSECRQTILALQFTRCEESKDEWAIFLNNIKNHMPSFDSRMTGIISDCAKGKLIFCNKCTYYQIRNNSSNGGSDS